MGKLTSRKLAIACLTIVAVVVLVLVVGQYPETSDFAGKALLAVTSVGLAALGGQFLLDNLNGKG